MLLHKTVIIEKEQTEQTGIIDPSKKSQVGIVKEIGALVTDNEMAVVNLAIGSRVIYYENSLLEIEYDGKKEYVLDYDDIVKVI